MNKKQTNSKPPARISQTAQRVIDERKQAARPRELAELSAIIKSRNGKLTDRQLDIVASIISYIVPPTSMPDAMESWLIATDAGALTEAYFNSPEWSKVLHRAFAAQCGETRSLRPLNSPDNYGSGEAVDPRRDYSVRRIRDDFGITDAEEETLGLTLLISERRRSAARRRAEGVPVAGARAKDEPWKRDGLSKATYYRRRSAERKSTQVRLLATLTSVAECEPGEAATENPASFSSYFSYDTVAESLTLSVMQQPHRGTAEARRLAALAQNLGVVWKGVTRRDVGSWFICPEGVVLTPDEASDLFAAEWAAGEAEERHNAVEVARSHAAYKADPRTPEQHAADWATKEAEQVAAHKRGDRPQKVSVAVWDAVPAELRTRVRGFAGAFFIEGYSPDVAVVYAVEQARRHDAIVAAVLKANPMVDMDRVAARVRQEWQRPTDGATAAILATLARDDETRRAVEQQVAAAIDHAWPPVLEEDRVAVMSGATETVVNGPHNDPRHAVRLAREMLHASRNPSPPQGYYRQYK